MWIATHVERLTEGTGEFKKMTRALLTPYSPLVWMVFMNIHFLMKVSQDLPFHSDSLVNAVNDWRRVLIG